MNTRHVISWLSIMAGAVQLGFAGFPVNQETQNFTSAPGDWVAAGPTNDGNNNYGFSNTDITAGASAAGEAGGKFYRDNTRLVFGDVTLGGLVTEASTFSASGELSVGNFTNLNSETIIGYLEKDTAGQPGDDNVGGHDWLGLMIGDSNATQFGMRARIYDEIGLREQGGRHDGAVINVTMTEARSFDLAWNPTARTLTARVLGATGNVLGTSTATLPADRGFAVDTYGLSVGTTGEPNPIEESHFLYIDATTYGRAITGDFNGSQAVQPEDFDLLGAEMRGAASDRMFDTNNDGAITLADRDAILASISRETGDSDLDGDVDLSDLGNLATGYEQAGATWARGDFDLDGDVDLSDLGTLATNYDAGSAAQAYAAFESMTGVPEPSACISLLASTLLITMNHRRARC